MPDLSHSRLRSRDLGLDGHDFDCVRGIGHFSVGVLFRVGCHGNLHRLWLLTVAVLELGHARYDGLVHGHRDGHHS